MFWQFGFSGWSYGRNHDDGFTIYLDEYGAALGKPDAFRTDNALSAEAQPLVYDHAAEVNRASSGFDG